MAKVHFVKRALKSNKKFGIKRGWPKQEIWKPVVGFEEWYEVSTLGRVKRLKAGPGTRAGRVLKPLRGVKGYSQVGMNTGGKCKGCFVHHLVLTAFIGPRPSGEEARHLNGRRNDNRLENLKWGTPKQNQADRVTHKTSNRGEAHPHAKLSDADVGRMRRLRADGWSCEKLANRFSLNESYVYKVVKMQRRKHLADRKGAFRGRGSLCQEG